MGVEGERERRIRERGERTAQQNVAFRGTLRGRSREQRQETAAMRSDLRLHSSAEQCLSGAVVPLSGRK